MKKESIWNFRSIAGRIILGLVLAAMLCSMDVAPAFSKERNRGHDNGRYEKRGHAYGHNKRAHRPYGHREPVYVAPRVIYAPPPPPGISVFFPPIFIPGR